MHSLAKFTSLIYEELLQMIGKKLTTPKQDFPDSRMVKILPCNAGAMGSIPSQRTIPHVLSSRDTRKDPAQGNKDPTCHSYDPRKSNK